MRLRRRLLIVYRVAHRRLAQGVIDREDVSETFLKGLPSATDRYDVIYPVTTLRRPHKSDCSLQGCPIFRQWLTMVTVGNAAG